MSERDDPATRLGRIRVSRGISQAHLARVTGISLRTLQRLEQGVLANPPIRYLAQCAIALEVDLDEVIEPEWRAWSIFDAAHAEAPSKGWWRHPYRQGSFKYSPYSRGESDGDGERGS